MPWRGLNGFIIPNWWPRTLLYNTYMYISGHLSQDSGSLPCSESKQEFYFLWQLTIYNFVLHFILSSTSRNLVIDLKQVERGIYKYRVSVFNGRLWSVPQSSLCLKLEEMVSFLGRSKRWAFWLNNKNKILCLCLTHVHPAENSKSCITGIYFVLKKVHFASLDPSTLQGLCRWL